MQDAYNHEKSSDFELEQFVDTDVVKQNSN